MDFSLKWCERLTRQQFTFLGYRVLIMVSSQESISISTLTDDRGVYTYVCILLLVFEATRSLSYLEHRRVKGAFHNGVRVPSIDRENERGRKKGKKFYAWCVVYTRVYYIYVVQETHAVFLHVRHVSSIFLDHMAAAVPSTQIETTRFLFIYMYMCYRKR